MNDFTRFAGEYRGNGTWHDSAGNSMGYRIDQSITVRDIGFGVSFKHDFEDGSVVNALFSMIWIAPNLFRVEIAGSPVGNGYNFGGYCHYHIKVGEAFIEVSYRDNQGELEVFGSSSKNADGNYIAWKEVLRRISI